MSSIQVFVYTEKIIFHFTHLCSSAYFLPIDFPYFLLVLVCPNAQVCKTTFTKLLHVSDQNTKQELAEEY